MGSLMASSKSSKMSTSTRSSMRVRPIKGLAAKDWFVVGAALAVGLIGEVMNPLELRVEERVTSVSAMDSAVEAAALLEAFVAAVSTLLLEDLGDFFEEDEEEEEEVAVCTEAASEEDEALKEGEEEMGCGLGGGE